MSRDILVIESFPLHLQLFCVHSSMQSAFGPQPPLLSHKFSMHTTGSGWHIPSITIAPFRVFDIVSESKVEFKVKNQQPSFVTDTLMADTFVDTLSMSTATSIVSLAFIMIATLFTVTIVSVETLAFETLFELLTINFKPMNHNNFGCMRLKHTVTQS